MRNSVCLSDDSKIHMKTLGEQPALPHFKIREEPTITCMHNQVGAVKGNAGSCRHLKIQTANYLLCHLSSNLNFVYKGDKSLTRDTVLHHGAFRTGDRAERMPDGSIRLLGRIKDVINVGGVKVFPLEVESVLNAHPWVALSRVRSAPEARLGEQVHAEVQLKSDHDPAAVHEALSLWCEERLAPLKRPAMYTVVTHLAMTASGKVIR